jgi:hypothetical protein
MASLDSMAGLMNVVESTRCDWEQLAPGRRRDTRSSLEAQAQTSPAACDATETPPSELGRQVAIDLQADANFDESRGRLDCRGKRDSSLWIQFYGASKFKKSGPGRRRSLTRIFRALGLFNFIQPPAMDVSCYSLGNPQMRRGSRPPRKFTAPGRASLLGADLRKTLAVFNFIQPPSGHERRLPPWFLERAPSKSAGRGVPCLLSNRLARLPRKYCVQYAEAVCDLPSLNPITTASAWTTTSLPAASVMKFRHMCSTVPFRALHPL